MLHRCLLLVCLIGCASAPRAQPQPSPAPGVAQAPPPAPTVPAGYIEMTAWKVIALPEGAALLLVDEKIEVAVPIFIGGTEGTSIHFRMTDERPPRPLTHDLLDSVLAKLGGKLEKVHIDALRDGVFHGSIFVRASSGRVHQIDARSSDAVALAIGARVPIYVAQAVVDEATLTPDELRQLKNRPAEQST
jgi:bifunctional DNase/RNase